jgi:hypothetical protein
VKTPDRLEKEKAVSNEQDDSVSKKTKGTPPTWKPADQLPRLKAPAGWVPKWCNPAKLTDRLSEGWKIMKPTDNKGDEIVNIDVNDSASLTGALKYRDMVAIMLPKELKEARDNWLRNENKEAMKGILKSTDKEFKDGGVETYTPKGHEGRVVIN